MDVARARKIEDEADARRCMRAARLAGQSAGEWGRAHGIDGRSLRAWGMNLERSKAGVPPRKRALPAMIRPTLVELVPTTPVAARMTARYVLEIAGARLEFGDDVSVVTLRRVMEALRAC